MVKIEIVDQAEIPETGRHYGGRPGGGKYEPIRQAILQAPRGKVVSVEMPTWKEAKSLQSALSGSLRRPTNSLYGKKLMIAVRGTTVYGWLREEEP